MWLPSGDSRAEGRLDITHTTRRRGRTGPLRQETLTTLSRPGRTQQYYGVLLLGNPRPVDKYPRTAFEYGNHVYICKPSYSTVDGNEQRNMVNSGVRGTKKNHLMIEMDCIYYLSYRNLGPTTGPSTGNLHYWFSRRLRRFGLR
jgi:hypothetical protein